MTTEDRVLGHLELVCPLAALPFLIFPSVLSALALVVLLVPWALRWRIYGRPTVRTPMDIAMLCLLFMVPISLWASALPKVSLPKLLGIILGVAFFYAAVNSVRSNQGQIWVWGALVVACGVMISCLALVGTDWFTHKMLPLGPLYQRLPRLINNVPGSVHGGFHPNEVGGTLALVLPVSVAALLAVWASNPGLQAGTIATAYPLASPLLRARWARITLSRKALVALTALCCLLMAGVLIMTQSRSAYMGIVVGLIALGAFRKRWILLLLPLIAIVGLLLLWYLGAQSILDGLLMLDTTGTANGRFEVWQRAIYMIQDFPYTGIGLNTFPYVGDVMYPYFLLGPDARVPHAHNNFLQIAVDLGIPGLVAYLALLTTFCLCVWKVYWGSESRSIRLLTAGLFSGMLAHQVYGLTDAITLGAKPGFILWTILGLVAALYRLETA
jgi:putative inorganic carbon (HCO3(-)) transporter